MLRVWIQTPALLQCVLLWCQDLLGIWSTHLSLFLHYFLFRIILHFPKPWVSLKIPPSSCAHHLTPCPCHFTFQKCRPKSINHSFPVFPSCKEVKEDHYKLIKCNAASICSVQGGCNHGLLALTLPTTKHNAITGTQINHSLVLLHRLLPSYIHWAWEP